MIRGPDPSTIENGSWVPTVEGYDAYIWHSVGRTCFTGVVEGEKKAWSCDWNCDGTTWGKKGWFNLNWLGTRNGGLTMAKVTITVEDTAYGIVDADVDFDPHLGDDRNWTLAQQIAMEMLEVVSREHAHNFEVRKTLKQENS